MTPDFKIVVENGANVTERIRDRLVSLSVYDSSDLHSDHLEIVLDDRDGKVATPTPGTVFKVWMGYKEDKKLAYRGKFVYDETRFSVAPNTVTISANATNFRGEMKAPRSRSWDQVTLGDIVQTIGSDHDYQTFVHPDLAAEVITHIDQTTESDLHFLTRLKKTYDAVFKIADGRLLFIPKGGGKSANTQATLPKVTLKPGDVTTCRVNINDRSRYGAVEVKYHDRAQAKELKAKAGNGVPVYQMKYPKATQAEAEAEAKSKYKQLIRDTRSLNTSLPGRGDLYAEAVIEMKEWRDGMNGEWLIVSANHDLDANGYRCTVQAEWNGD